MSSGKPIQASLQVDLDFTRIHEKGRQADRIAEQADRKAEALKRKAQEISREFDQEEARMRRAASMFQTRVLENPLKKIGKIGVAMAAAEWAGVDGEEAGSGRSYLGRVGKAALFGLAAGPQGAVISALGASVDWLIEEQRNNIKEIQDIRKRLNEEKYERQMEAIQDRERIRELQEQAAELKHQNEIKVIEAAEELDYQTWRLMSG